MFETLLKHKEKSTNNPKTWASSDRSEVKQTNKKIQQKTDYLSTPNIKIRLKHWNWLQALIPKLINSIFLTDYTRLTLCETLWSCKPGTYSLLHRSRLQCFVMKLYKDVHVFVCAATQRSNYLLHTRATFPPSRHNIMATVISKWNLL